MNEQPTYPPYLPTFLLLLIHLAVFRRAGEEVLGGFGHGSERHPISIVTHANANFFLSGEDSHLFGSERGRWVGCLLGLCFFGGGGGVGVLNGCVGGGGGGGYRGEEGGLNEVLTYLDGWHGVEVAADAAFHRGLEGVLENFEESVVEMGGNEGSHSPWGFVDDHARNPFLGGWVGGWVDGWMDGLRFR